MLLHDILGTTASKLLACHHQPLNILQAAADKPDSVWRIMTLACPWCFQACGVLPSACFPGQPDCSLPSTVTLPLTSVDLLLVTWQAAAMTDGCTNLKRPELERPPVWSSDPPRVIERAQKTLRSPFSGALFGCEDHVSAQLTSGRKTRSLWKECQMAMDLNAYRTELPRLFY